MSAKPSSQFATFDLGNAVGRDDFLRTLLSVHRGLVRRRCCDTDAVAGLQPATIDDVRAFLSEMHEALDGKAADPALRDLVIAIYDYWYQVFPEFGNVNEPQPPKLKLPFAALERMKSIISRHTPPKFLDSAAQILVARRFDPELLGDPDQMTDSLWNAVMRFCRREDTLGAERMSQLLAHKAIGSYFPYTTIDRGFLRLRQEMEFVQGELFKERAFQPDEHESGLWECFTDSALSWHPILFQFMNFIFGEPRATNLGYLPLGTQHLVCVAIDKKASVFGVDEQAPCPNDPIVCLNDFVSRVWDDDNGVKAIPHTESLETEFYKLCEAAVEPTSTLLRHAIRRASARHVNGLLRCHDGFIFSSLVLESARRSFPIPLEEEKTLPGPFQEPGPLENGKLIDALMSCRERQTIWALDPWYYFILRDQRIQERYHVLMLPHGITVPVGLAFSDLFLPDMMRSRAVFSAIRLRAGEALRPFASQLLAIGVALHPPQISRQEFHPTVSGGRPRVVRNVQ